MKAIVYSRFGSPDVLELREVGQPKAGEGEVLVRVHAASVNPADWYAMTGTPYVARPQMGLRKPKGNGPGLDLAGEVTAVGGNVTRFKPGDEVFGAATGTLAEYVAASEDGLVPKPANLSFEQAAAVPVAGLTALQGLRDKGRVQQGQQVLINGASGGVGTFSVQVAKALGAQVTAVCSTRNLQQAEELGADESIDYTVHDFTCDGRRYDILIDLVGNRRLRDLGRALAPGGILVLSGGGVPGTGRIIGPLGLLVRAQLWTRLTRTRLVAPLGVPDTRNLTELGRLLASGEVRPVIETTYPLEHSARAIRHLETQHATGKVVLVAR